MLKPETQALWNTLKDAQGLRGFVLIGGTALAMHLQHRVSEDLDFAWLETKLPRTRIEAIKRFLETQGHRVMRNDSPAAIAEFEDSGLDLYDYQQDFIVDEAVKLTFVAIDQELIKQMRAANPDHVRVAAVDEIFRLKCIACANRSKTRDWFDIYTLFERGLFQPIDMIEPFERLLGPSKLDIALMRMCSARPEKTDEGYLQLTSDAPTLATMQKRFEAARGEIEVELARRAAKDSRSDRG